MLRRGTFAEVAIFTGRVIGRIIVAPVYIVKGVFMGIIDTVRECNTEEKPIKDVKPDDVINNA